jgi:hypothetical protein
VQATHLHLLVEASDERALSRGVRAFEISVARRLNKAVGRKGRVFRDRYHADALTTPRTITIAAAAARSIRTRARSRSTDGRATRASACRAATT